MRRLPAIVLALAVGACAEDDPLPAVDAGGGSGDASDPTASTGGGSDTDGDAESSGVQTSGAPPGCQADDDCGDDEVCEAATGECVCAEGYVDCEGACRPALAADVELAPFEVVDDAPDVSGHFDVDLGLDGEPFVLYSRNLYDVWIARRSDAGWALEPVHSPLYGRLDGASLALDSAGEPTIVVAEFENGTSTWRKGTVVDGQWAFGYDLSRDDSSIGQVDVAFDAEGTLHTAYGFRFFSTSDLHLWVSPDSQLRALRLDAQAGASNLVLAADGTPHLAYDIPGFGVLHTHAQDGDWLEEEIEPLSTNIGVVGPHIALDLTGQPVVGYLREGPGEYVIARRDAAGWSVGVAFQDFDLRYAALALDDLGVPHVLYQRDDLSITYARHDGVAWSHHDIPGGPDSVPGRFTVTRDGTAAHILWVAGNTKPAAELRYARVGIGVGCG